MIWLSRFQAQGASASALSSGHVLLHMSYYDKGFSSLMRKSNGKQMSRQIWKEIPSDPSRLKSMACQLRMKRVTHFVNSTTWNTATLFPKNWLNGCSANRAKYWCHEKYFVVQGKKSCICEIFANLKCSRIKIRLTFFSLPVPAALLSET